MPNNTETTLENRTLYFYAALEEEVQKLKDRNAEASYIEALENFINKAKRTELYEALRKKVRGRYVDPELEEGQAAIEKYEKMARDLKDAGNSLRSKMAEVQSGNNKTLKKENVFIASLLSKNTDVLEQTQRAFDIAAELVKSNSAPDEDKLRKYYEEFPENGVRPSIEECCSISIKDAAPEKVFKHLYWLSHLESTTSFPAMQGQSIYSKAYDRLITELNDAPIDKKMEYAEIFCNHHKADKLSGYNDRVFYRLVSKLGGGDFSGILNRFAPDMRPKELIRAGYQTEASPRLKTLSSLGNEYEKMLLDERTASESFTAMRDSVRDFIAIEERYLKQDAEIPAEDLKEYSHKINRAMDTVSIYLDTHKGKRGSNKGKERKQIAENLKQTLEARMTMLNQRIADLENDRKLNELLPESNKLNQVDPALADKLIALGKIQRHISPVRTIPKVPEYKAEPSNFQKFKGALGHYIFSGVTILVGNTFGRLISNIARPFTQRSKERPQYELDTDLIPGTKGEHFKDVPVDNEPDDQPILSDTRRVPLVFEKPLPEDPNQAPTISLEFSQGIEGDPRSLVQNGTGHGHITLNYSKINPLTGKMQRYGLTVGFYPKGGFDTTNIRFASYLNGLRIPGAITDDWGNPYATRKTFKANNKQINKVLLAVQGYDKDGYNAITRNCSTFVADMAKVAGIDISSIMQEVDFTTDISKDSMKLKLLGAPGMALLGPQFTRLAKRDILKKVGKKDLSYKAFGQDMLNAQDVKRLWSLDFNTRLKGYNPNYTAESIRKEKGAKLSSRQYNGNFVIRKDDYDNRLLGRLSSVGVAIMDLKNDIISWEREKKNGNPEIGGKVEKYCNTMKYALASQINKLRSNSGESFEEKDEQYKKLNSTIESFKDEIDNIYHESFKDDPEYNMSFTHLMSTVEFLQFDLANQYSKFIEAKEPSNPEKDNNKLVDSLTRTQDTYSVTNGKGGRYNIPVSPAYAAGLIKAYGSLSRGLFALGQAAESDQLSGAEEHQLEAVEDFANAEKSFFSGRALTVEDIKFAFVELPANMNDKNLLRSGNPAYSPEQIYQSQVLNQMFGGLKKDYKDFLKEYSKAPDNQKASLAESFTKKLDDRITKGLENPGTAQMMETLKMALVPEIVKTTKRIGNNDINYYNRVNAAFYRQFKNALVDSYLKPLVEISGRELLAEKSAVLNVKDLNTVMRKVADSGFAKLEEAVKGQPINAQVDALEAKPPVVQ